MTKIRLPSCPSKDAILRWCIKFVNWYSTRLVVVLVWCGVVWAILGTKDLSPYNENNTMISNNSPNRQCLSLAPSSNIHQDMMDSLFFDSQDNITLTYILSCNRTIFTFPYCLTTLSVNSSCPSMISVQLKPFDANSNNMTSFNNTLGNNDTFNIDINIYQSLIDILFPPSIQPTQSTTLLDIPQGHFFGLLVLVLCSSFGGFLVNLIRLPPLLGMMIAGFILRNIPSLGLVEGISPVWSSVLRNIALVIILIRGGLALDAKKLWALKFVLPLLAILPCVFEGGVDGTISIFYLQLPWQWGLALGFLLSAISPAVVVPTVLTLKEKVTGINEGISTLIVAAANVDVVIAISLFSIFLGLIFSAGNIVLDVFRAPIELTVGVLYGVLAGLVLWVLPTKFHTQASKERNRFFLLFGLGLFSLFGGRRALLGGASLAGAGALGTVVVAFVSVQKMSSNEKTKLSRSFYLVWQFAQPILFGLIGAALNISTISGTLVGKAIVIILSGLIVRVIVAVLSVTGNKFTIKEKIFIACAWLPKATVQAALGSIPLDLARQSGDRQLIENGETVLTVAVLAIVMTAPVGAVLTGVFGPFLLKHETDPSSLQEEGGEGSNSHQINGENEMKDICHQDYNKKENDQNLTNNNNNNENSNGALVDTIYNNNNGNGKETSI